MHCNNALCDTLQRWYRSCPMRVKGCTARVSPVEFVGDVRIFSSTHCNTLQHTATHCNTLQHTAKTHIAKEVQILPSRAKRVPSSSWAISVISEKLFWQDVLDRALHILKEPYAFWKEPYMFWKETQNSSTSSQKSCTHSEKSPTYSKKSPTHSEKPFCKDILSVHVTCSFWKEPWKSPTYPPKSPTYSGKSPERALGWLRLVGSLKL